MISQDLLDILACPETKQHLLVAEQDLIDKINQQIEQGMIKNRAGEPVKEKIDGGLVQKDTRAYLYPIREDIPIMLIDEAIPLSRFC